MKCETKIVKPEPYFEAVFEGSLFLLLSEMESLFHNKNLSRKNGLLDMMYSTRCLEVDRQENNDIAEAIIKHNGWTVPDDMPIKLTVK